MLNSGDLKDKYILREGPQVFIPCVEWFEWPVWRLTPCTTCGDAQAILALFPLDPCEGYLGNLEREPDEPAPLEECPDPASFPAFAAEGIRHV